MNFLPYSRQSLDESDIAAVSAVLRSDWLTQGPAVGAFEQALAAVTGAAQAVACASGTAALHLAALALDLAPGDTVVVPAITFLATANAVCLAGGEVAFADVDPDTGLMTPETLEAAVARARAAGRRVRAVFPVHLAGQVTEVGAAAERLGLVVVEDACHALGSRRGLVRPLSTVDGAGGSGDPGRPVGDGQPALMTAFSFHPVKTVACGEGGAITTNDQRLADRLRRLRNHGVTRDASAFQVPELAFADDGSGAGAGPGFASGDRTPNPWYYEMSELGLNYRLSDLHAALGTSQLHRLEAFAARRRALVAHYRHCLAPFAPWVRPVAVVPGCLPAWHLCVVLIDFAACGTDRATVMRRLRAAGIGSQVHYIPVPHQPWYRQRYGRPDLPDADAYYRQVLSLPLFTDLADADVNRVVATLAEVLGVAGDRLHPQMPVPIRIF